MKNKTAALSETEFIDYIRRGAARLSTKEVQAMVSMMPGLREQFSRFRGSPYPETERQLWFLSCIVEKVWTDAYREMSYSAALEAAFAITYFVRDTDLIPDSIGPLGLTDDCAVVQTVLARNAQEYERFRAETKLDWSDFQLRSDAP